MELTISIAHVGHAKGTIGWLAENASTIKISKTKEGDQGAWLYGKDGKVITVLAVREYGGIVRAENDVMCPVQSDISFTPAAWVVVEKLIDAAEAAMEAGENAAIGEAMAVEVKS